MEPGVEATLGQGPGLPHTLATYMLYNDTTESLNAVGALGATVEGAYGYLVWTSYMKRK